MKKLFTFFVAATMLATIGVTAQTEGRVELQKKMQSRHEQMNKQRNNGQPPQERASLRSGGVSYTALDYSTVIPVNGAPVQGTFTEQDNTYLNMWGYTASGKGFRFTPQAGKVYKITCKYQTSQENDWWNSGFAILTGGTLTGDDDDDVINYYNDWNYGTELTVKAYFTGDGSSFRFLLNNYSLNDVINYTITIEETNISSYTTLNYSTPVSANGSPVSGSFTEQNNKIFGWWNVFTGNGYSFTAQAGKTYKITCKYTASEYVEMYLRCYILKSGTLTGNYDDDVIKSNDDWNYGTEATLTTYFMGNGPVRLLLCDHYLNDLSYTITIEEVNVPLYTALNYSTPVPVNGAPVTGSFTAQNNMALDWEYNPFTGKGYSFTAQSGKVYKITCKYVASEYCEIAGGFYVLTGGTLTGNDDDDVITGCGEWEYGTETTITGYFTTSTGGTVRLLLRDYFLNDLSYTITIEETNVPTLTGLLNSTSNTITYSGNMQFTASGVTTDMVAGNEDLKFRSSGIFYVAAYKIALTAGNNIQIHSSKEYDSYLYIYKSDGAGGYEYIGENDDDYDYDYNESYLNFTASESGVYYIVVTDYNRESAGRYYLTVWNTAEEPYNGYTGIENIAAANAATVYTSDRNIIISNAETGSLLMVADMTGRIITNTTARSSEITIPVSAAGIYIVRTGAQTVKVICK